MKLCGTYDSSIPKKDWEGNEEKRNYNVKVNEKTEEIIMSTCSHLDVDGHWWGNF